MPQPVPIMVDGSLAGAAMSQGNGVRFIATDMRTAEIDQTMWSSVEDVRRAVEQMVRTGRNRPSIKK
jgi:hypothetical protein